MKNFFRRNKQILAVTIEQNGITQVAFERYQEKVHIKAYETGSLALESSQSALFNVTDVCFQIRSFVKKYGLSRPQLAISLSDRFCIELIASSFQHEPEGHADAYAWCIMPVLNQFFFAGIPQTLLIQLYCLAARSQIDLATVATTNMAYCALLNYIDSAWATSLEKNRPITVDIFYQEAYKAVITGKLQQKIEKAQKLDWNSLLVALGLYYAGTKHGSF